MWKQCTNCKTISQWDYYLTPVRMAPIKKTKGKKCQWGYGQ
jgi:hypothetical protein